VLSANFKPKTTAAASRGFLSVITFTSDDAIRRLYSVRCNFYYSNRLDSAVLNAYLWTESKRNLPPLDAFSGLFYAQNAFAAWGRLQRAPLNPLAGVDRGLAAPSPTISPPLSALRASAVCAYRAPLNPLYGVEGVRCPSPITPPPLSALRASSFGPSGRAFPLFLFYETTTAPHFPSLPSLPFPGPLATGGPTPVIQLGGPSLPPSLPFPFPSPSPPFPSFPLPLKVGPLIAARGSGGAL